MEPTEGIDLFIPPIYDILGSLLILLVLVSAITLCSNYKYLSSKSALWWLFGIFAVPFLGQIAWLTLGLWEVKKAKGKSAEPVELPNAQ